MVNITFANKTYKEGVEAHKNGNPFLAEQSRETLQTMVNKGMISPEYLRDYDGDTDGKYKDTVARPFWELH